MSVLHSNFFRNKHLAGIMLALAAMLVCAESPAQTLVGLEFVGGTTGTTVTTMGTGESAGVIAQTNWNSLANASGTDTTLVNSTGATVSGLSVSYTALNTWADGAISDTAGNNRLMRGYLDFNVNTGSTTVTVSGITSPIYDVYVYSNGDANTRVGKFEIGAQTYWLKDSSTFTGTFTQGTDTADTGSFAATSAGNYMVFSGLTDSSFTLNASGVYTTDGTYLRAPVNAIQIVIPTNVLYWDRNGTTAGAGTSTAGTWATSGSNRSNWNTTASGSTTTPGNWTNGSVAVFSAGTDATGSYAVNVASSSIQTSAVYIQEGNVTFSGTGSIKFSDSTPDFVVASGSSAVVNVGLENSTTSASAIGLQKLGAGTLTLGSTTNAYTGKTVITEGTLRIGTSGVIPNGSAVTIASGATFDVNGFTETVGSVAGAGTIALGTGTLFAGGDNTSTLFSGAITGTGIFSKDGTGTLTLGNDLSFGGEFRIGGGTLALNGFDLTVNTLRITGNSIIDFGDGLSSILTTSNLILDAGVTLTINNWADTIDYFYALTNPGGTQGTAPLNQIVFNGFSGSATKWQSFDKQVTPVPEPGAYGALLSGLALLVSLWRLKKKA